MTGTKNQKISVLMTVCNGEKYLKEAIDSILGQTFSDFEFLIINDGSTDESAKIVQAYDDPRIYFVNNAKNKGLISALNEGLGIARGEYIARMDQDDISLRNRLKKQYEFLEDHPDISLVGGWAEIINKNGEKIGIKKTPLDYPEIKFSLLSQNPLIHSTIFFRKNTIKNLGGYNKKDEHAEDYGLYSTLITSHKIVNLPEFLIKFRVHSSSIGQTSKTKAIQDKTARRITLDNINRYITLSQNDFAKYYNILSNKNFNLRGFLNYLRINREIYCSFIKKETLNKGQTREVSSIYKTKKWAIIKMQYIKHIKKVPFLHSFTRFLYLQFRKTR